MTTYAELKAQADALNAQAEIARKQEIAEVVQRIKADMKEYGITVLDIGGHVITGKSKAAKTKSTAPAKYKGPNGELWSGGLGRRPEWVRNVLAAGGTLDAYAIGYACFSAPRMGEARRTGGIKPPGPWPHHIR